MRPYIFASLVAASLAFVQDRGIQDSIPGAYIFEMKDGYDTETILETLADEVTVRMVFNFKLFKGVSVQFHDTSNMDERINDIKKMSNVNQSWPIGLLHAPKYKVQVVPAPNISHTLSPRWFWPINSINRPHITTQVSKLHSNGITGKDVKIAVVDSGIDYKHPALGECFGKGCLVSFGTDLVGSDYDGENTPIPDDDPMDCLGHGTHVAGIIAARHNALGFSGVAPGVTLGAYRVLGCKGTAALDILTAALYKAFEDGAHIITSSIGAPSGWGEELWATAVSRITDQGVPFIQSAGNDGQKGLFYLGSIGGGQKGTSVASFSNAVTPIINIQSWYNMNGRLGLRFILSLGQTSVWGVSMPLYATSLDTEIADDACGPLPDSTPDLGKYIVLVRRGTCPYSSKAENIAAKGAKYVIFYNYDEETVPFSFAGKTHSILGSGMVPYKIGREWVEKLKVGYNIIIDVPSTFSSWNSEVIEYANNKTGGAISSFTSWGPNFRMNLEPQIGAPGESVISTYPVAKGSYAILSGTSMACPMVAGIYALISEVRKTRNPEYITNLLSATAKAQLFHDGTDFSHILAPPAQQGGGMVQAYDAAYTKTELYPSSLSFNDTDHFATVLNFTITNKGNSPTTYTIRNKPSLTMYTLEKDSTYPMEFPNEVADAYATLSFYHNTYPVKRLNIDPGHRVIISVKPKPPRRIDSKRLALWSGYITVNGTDKSALSLPYQGLAGSLYSAVVLEPTRSKILITNDGQNFTMPPENSTVTVVTSSDYADEDIRLVIYMELAFGSAHVAVDVVPLGHNLPTNLITEVTGEKTIGQVFRFPQFWLTRGKTLWSWDGKLNSGKYAPPGRYKLVTRALRIYGDPTKKEDWNTASTQPFFLKYEQ
ncbi:hypothetical protein QQS21_005823 [Conoideocrella luteorostrata]|uniref:Uncharacterized protein n=1 Tax=Conoideocrella luteorostrata TaxID=1105319 RepID=A0AAJ0CPS0_9HYPO|nr:hypothetical protein QQS21_005823 [Conoideocrella luteorostrata]